ncbi:MAG: hypothetical protein AB7K09_24245 [Planctomycetota bacterium]
MTRELLQHWMQHAWTYALNQDAADAAADAAGCATRIAFDGFDGEQIEHPTAIGHAVDCASDVRVFEAGVSQTDYRQFRYGQASNERIAALRAAFMEWWWSRCRELLPIKDADTADIEWGEVPLPPLLPEKS